ncbi:hypothetical protein [Streptococcus plurextorum]|uniref:hypothetical protein n=1 Tax=Streptococcus plurextorum TaxID=456876 RepID=UPI000424076A|nr:hypothetical protein [Streptococcus plurextorum]
MKKLFGSENIMTWYFLALYGIGFFINIRGNNLLMAILCGLLFLLNGGLFAYRIWRKENTEQLD